MAEKTRGEIFNRGRKEADRGDGGPRQTAGDVAQAAGGTEASPPGRLKMDRNSRYLSLWRVWIQPGGCSHWSGWQPEFSRGQSLGQARVQGSRRRGRTRHAQYKTCATAFTKIRANWGSR